MENEIWKDIFKFEGLYQISNLGRVKNLERRVRIGFSNYRTVKERILSQVIGSSGYLKVSLYKDSKCNTFRIHTLLAIAFLNHNQCSFKLVVNHKNFIKTDNRLSNLEIITNRENTNKNHLNSSSIYTGVSLIKKTNKWKSMIYVDGKNRTIGTFDNEIDAHIAYQNKLNILLKNS